MDRKRSTPSMGRPSLGRSVGNSLLHRMAEEAGTLRGTVVESPRVRADRSYEDALAQLRQPDAVLATTLAEHVTLADALAVATDPAHMDVDWVWTFLLTYRTLCSDAELVELLEALWDAHPARHARVVQLLKLWVRRLPQQFKHDVALTRLVSQLLHTRVLRLPEHQTAAGKLAMDLIQLQKEGERSFSPLAPPLLHGRGTVAELGLDAAHPTELARQITLLAQVQGGDWACRLVGLTVVHGSVTCCACPTTSCSLCGGRGRAS